MNQCTLTQADVIIVCDKLDTGYNEPALMAMYLDRPIHSFSRIVQLLSRLNRFKDGKQFVHVLDYVNHPLQIRRGFTAYHNQVSCSLNGRTCGEIEMNYETSCMILWDLLLFDHGNFIADDASIHLIEKRLEQLDQDTIGQIIHAVKIYLQTIGYVGKEARYLRREWIESIQNLLIHRMKSYLPEETTSISNELKKKIKIQKISFETRFHGDLWTNEKFTKFQKLMTQPSYRDECTSETEPTDLLDMKIQNLIKRINSL